MRQAILIDGVWKLQPVVDEDTVQQLRNNIERLEQENLELKRENQKHKKWEENR